MTCETLFQNLAASLTPEMITKLCRRHQITLPEAKHGKVAIFQLAHKHCHRDAPFARQLQRYLNRKHAVAITRLSLLQPDDIQAHIEALLSGSQTALPESLPGILWAVSSDPREGVRPIEQMLVDELHLLSHCLLLAQFHGDIKIIDADHQDDAMCERQQQTFERLQAERDAKQREITQLKRTNTSLTQDKAQLQRQLDVLSQRCERLEKQCQRAQRSPSQPSVSPRELKKLQYELTKLTETLQEKDNEIARLVATVSTDESHDPTETTEAVQSPSVAESTSKTETEWPSVDLSGKTVALIGGLTKASVHYEEAIHAFGGSCVLHDGHVHQGE